MEYELSPSEIRALGCLVEKESLTPDIYPLSLASLTAACNQKTSREPVMSLTESDVQAALDSLMHQHLVREKSPSGSRVTKYAHRLSPDLGLSFDFGRDGVAVLCVLMLRGPQTPGELRTRTERLHRFADVGEVERTLERLATVERGPYVRALPRQAGRREIRFMHLFGGQSSVPDDTPGEVADAPCWPEEPPSPSRLDALERRVAVLEEQLADLREALGVAEPPAS